jgi:hypothetical protein
MLVPQVGGYGGEHGGGWHPASGGAGKGVEVPITIAAKDHATGLQILHRETKGVKLNGREIIMCKLANR